MELYEVMRSAAASRDYLTTPVDDDVVHRMLENARFASNGGNRQPWRAIIVKDPVQKVRLREQYVFGYRETMAYGELGISPFSPEDTWQKRSFPVDRAEAHKVDRPNEFADHLETVPVLMLICVELAALSVTDNDSGHQSVVGGASIYPFVQNVLLAARNEGLAGLLATVVSRQERELRIIFDIPNTHALACLIALGYPNKRVTKLSRRPVESFASIDKFDGVPFILDAEPQR